MKKFTRYLEKKEHILYRNIIDVGAARGDSRDHICEKVSEKFRNELGISQLSPATVNNIWKWYRKEILSKKQTT